MKVGTMQAGITYGHWISLVTPPVALAIGLAVAITMNIAVPPVSAQEGEVQATSLLGQTLMSQPAQSADALALLAAAGARPDSTDLWMRAGIALAGSWHYQQAIDAYSRGMQNDPFAALLYRHRGHRFISTRRFDAAAADLELSSRLDPTNWDTWYHLGLAHYLRGDFAAAETAYRRCLDLATDDGALVAVSDWLWMTLARRGDRAGAEALLTAIHPDMQVGENGSYHRRLLMYKGLLQPAELLDLSGATDLDVATIGYGVGNYHLVMGNEREASAIFRRVVSGPYWPAFGFIAAEAELARQR